MTILFTTSTVTIGSLHIIPRINWFRVYRHLLDFKIGPVDILFMIGSTTQWVSPIHFCSLTHGVDHRASTQNFQWSFHLGPTPTRNEYREGLPSAATDTLAVE